MYALLYMSANPLSSAPAATPNASVNRTARSYASGSLRSFAAPAAIVESVERQKARMRAHLAELDALFASLQSRAFSGTL